MKQKIWKIIPQRFRRRAIVVAATIFLRALLNFVGVAMLLPILLLIIDNGNIESNSYLSSAYNTLGFTDYTSFTTALLLAIVGIIVVKNLSILLLYRFERGAGRASNYEPR